MNEGLVEFLRRHHIYCTARDGRFEEAADTITRQAREIEALKVAGQSVIDQMFDYYTARNGRRMSIEGDDGEKCWIVPFDAMEELRAALSPTTGGD